MTTHSLPEIGFLRIGQILGDQHATPPIPPILPISRAAFYQGIKDGRYPAGVKLSARSVAWPVESIRELIDRINQNTLPDTKV